MVSEIDVLKILVSLPSGPCTQAQVFLSPTSNRQMHEPPDDRYRHTSPFPCSKSLAGRQQTSRVFVGIEVGPRIQVLDLVDPWLQLSVFEEG